MFEKKPSYALVLSGGGAKGAYEIGAWRALRELGIKICAVGGASVGALNAAVIAQDAYDFGVKLWSEMTIDKVVDLPEGLLDSGRAKFSFKNLMRIGDLHLDIKNLGLDPAPLRELLKTEIDEEKIRRSGIDLGIVTIKLDNFSPCEIFLEDMPYGTLPDYLLASASFPAFKRAEINGKQFTDGGMYDNIPHAMMKNRGYRKIIVIDIAGLGVNKRPDLAGTDTIYIRTSVPLGNVLDFNPDKAKIAMEAGYLDTMKVFEKNDGRRYFIRREPKKEQEMLNMLKRPENIVKYSEHLNLNYRNCTPANAENLIREILPADMRSNKNLMLCLLESAAYALSVERIKLYSFSGLADAVRDRYAEIVRSGSLPSKSETESFFKMIEEAFEDTIELFRSDRNLSEYSPYEYARIMRNQKAAHTLIPEIRAAEIFLSVFL